MTQQTEATYTAEHVLELASALEEDGRIFGEVVDVLKAYASDLEKRPTREGLVSTVHQLAHAFVTAEDYADALIKSGVQVRPE